MKLLHNKTITEVWGDEIYVLHEIKYTEITYWDLWIVLLGLFVFGFLIGILWHREHMKIVKRREIKD